MFGRILQSLQAAEVDGALDRGVTSADVFGTDRGRQGRTLCDLRQGGAKPPLHQQWRGNAVRQRAQLDHGSLDI